MIQISVKQTNIVLNALFQAIQWEDSCIDAYSNLEEESWDKETRRYLTACKNTIKKYQKLEQQLKKKIREAVK